MSIDPTAFNQFVTTINGDIAKLNVQFEELQKRVSTLEEQNTYLRNTIVRLVAEHKGVRYEDIEKVIVSEDGTLNLIIKTIEPNPLNPPPVSNPYA